MPNAGGPGPDTGQPVLSLRAGIRRHGTSLAQSIRWPEPMVSFFGEFWGHGPPAGPGFRRPARGIPPYLCNNTGGILSVASRKMHRGEKMKKLTIAALL